MHVVTKILIVFCAVFCLVLSALSIAYAGNATALRDSVKGLQARAAAAEISAQNEIAQASQEKTVQAERLQALQNEVGARAKEVADLQAERTSLRADFDRATADAASIRNQIAQLGATADTQAKLIDAYRQEVAQLREANLAAQKREIELVDRVNELDASREVLEQNARALKEQLEETKLQLSQAQQGVAAGSSRVADATPREISGSLVRAQVTEVFRSPTGETMVTISEGASRGIRENALMHMIRGSDQFVGSIVITAVEANRSVGRLNTYGRDVAAQTGDLVLSRLSN